jgi:high-affinity iron transporter
MVKGERLYEQRCAVCHGAKGTGDGPMVGSLRQKPWSFADKRRMAQEKDDRHF